MTSLRLVIDPAADGVTNMARDEALLQRVGRGESVATLRFYRWSPATISLGYFQAYAEYEALPSPAGGLDVVRRQTGGGAILHDVELTYALVLPMDHPLIGAAGPSALYGHVHGVFAAWLSAQGVPVAPGPPGTGGCSHRGPFFCFARHSCFDLLADGRKILGSAQRRTASAVLQHGSLVLGRRFEQQSCAAVSDFTAARIDDALPDLARAVARNAGATLDSFTNDESALADELRAKYAGAAWTRQR